MKRFHCILPKYCLNRSRMDFNGYRVDYIAKSITGYTRNEAHVTSLPLPSVKGEITWNMEKIFQAGELVEEEKIS